MEEDSGWKQYSWSILLLLLLVEIIIIILLGEFNTEWQTGFVQANNGERRSLV